MTLSLSRPRESLYSQLRGGRSVLRSETTVALSRLRLEIEDSPSLLDAGGPTIDVCEALAIDASRRVTMNLSRDREPDVIGDLDRPWPFASAGFDVVLSSYVLEHVRDPRRFFHESFRCLSAGGVLVLTTVLIHVKHSSPHDFFRFTDDGLLMLATEAGFEARALPVVDGPAQAVVSMFSPFLLLPTLRFLAVKTARACDRIAKRLFPFVADNWCAAYVLVARKPGA